MYCIVFLYFENNAEELYFHETFIMISLHQNSVILVYLVPIKLYETSIEIDMDIK